MKTYELTYIISPEITSEEAEAFSKELESYVQSKEGNVLKQAHPTAKVLSYPIKKYASGFVGSLEFSIEADKLAEIKEKMDKDGKIIRHMLIIKEPVRERRQRAARKETAPVLEKKSAAIEEKTSIDKEEPVKHAKKVELKDIEQKLDEILGE
jgi:ribosomal protein S6